MSELSLERVASCLCAPSLSQVPHHSKHGCDGKQWEGAQAGRDHRQGDLGVPFFLPYHKAISSSLEILYFFFFFANFYDMQLSYSIREKERTCLQSCCASPSLNRRGQGVQRCLP